MKRPSKVYQTILPLILVMLISMACYVLNLLSQERTEAESVSDETESPMDLRGAEETLAMFLSAVVEQDLDTATSLISEYSLTVIGSTKTEVRNDLAEWALLEYKILESRRLDDDTALVQVFIKDQSKRVKLPAVSEFWIALRIEDGEWQVNLFRLVDEQKVETPAVS